MAQKDGFHGYCDECEKYVGMENLVKHSTADLWFCSEKCLEKNEEEWLKKSD